RIPSERPSWASQRPGGPWPAPAPAGVLEAAETVPLMVTSPQTARITGRDPTSVSEPLPLMDSALIARTTASGPPSCLITVWVGAGCPAHQDCPPSAELNQALLHPMVIEGAIPRAAIAAGSKLLGRYRKVAQGPVGREERGWH